MTPMSAKAMRDRESLGQKALDVEEKKEEAAERFELEHEEAATDAASNELIDPPVTLPPIAAANATATPVAAAAATPNATAAPKAPTSPLAAAVQGNATDGVAPAATAPPNQATALSTTPPAAGAPRVTPARSTDPSDAELVCYARRYAWLYVAHCQNASTPSPPAGRAGEAACDVTALRRHWRERGSTRGWSFECPLSVAQLTCYAQRYPWLLASYCAGNPATCDTAKLSRHWERVGSANGWRHDCPVGRYEWRTAKPAQRAPPAEPRTPAQVLQDVRAAAAVAAQQLLRHGATFVL